jgi:hypothetical protein
MKATFCKQHRKYRIIIPPKYTGTGKRQLRFFESKELAEVEARRVRNEGAQKKLNVSDDDLALLALIKAKYDGDAKRIFDAFDHHEKTVLSVAKPASLLEAAIAYEKHQTHEERNPRTIYKYRSTLRRLCHLLKPDLRMCELTEDKINLYLKQFGPGTTRLSQYRNIHAFVTWAFQERYLGVDPMARMKPTDKWGVNNDHLEVEEFRRILFVIAGLEPIKPGEPVTDRYLRLLPFYVLGGLAGLRRCEIISSYASDPVIEWADILWPRNLIRVRHEVGKQTGATDQSRWVPLEPAAAEWLRLVPVKTTPVMEISQSTLQRLNKELLDALGLEVPDNALRNSYASFAASIRTSGVVADAMGDNESTMKRFYTKRLEPGLGTAWFGIRPTMNTKIIQMPAAAVA